MSRARALVISIDAMTGEDLAPAQKYPNFAALTQGCALATNVESVFPSLTYPCHVAMATGCTPMHTGVLNNEIFLPDSFRRPWYFYASQIRRPTIFAAAAAAGVSTGCVMWPCMGKGPIDVLVPEIWGDAPDASFLEPFCSAGTEDFIREIWPSVSGSVQGFRQPMFDDFVCRIAEALIRRRSPELLYVHMCQVDNAKHCAGLRAPAVVRAIENTDALLGRLLAALEAAGVRDQTNVVLCSDHGQLPVERVSYPNRLLASHGLLSMKNQLDVGSWRAQTQSACLSAFLYARPEDAGRAVELLHAHRDALGIVEILPRSLCRKRYQIDGDFTAVLLGTPGTYFHNAADVGPLRLEAADGPMPYRANHGHDPQLGEKPFFLINGPAARAGARIDRGLRLIDEPATIAAIMGFDLPGADGRAVRKLLK